MSIEFTVGIFNLHVSFVQATELEWPKVDIPNAVVNFFQSNIFACADAGDVDPVAAPADATVGADVADFEAVWIFEGW